LASSILLHTKYIGDNFWIAGAAFASSLNSPLSFTLILAVKNRLCQEFPMKFNETERLIHLDGCRPAQPKPTHPADGTAGCEKRDFSLLIGGNVSSQYFGEIIAEGGFDTCAAQNAVRCSVRRRKNAAAYSTTDY
jgi:hypothetical protein